MDRRKVVQALASAPVIAACRTETPTPAPAREAEVKDAVLAIRPLGFPWHTQDPFLFCVHHDDAYPAGNAEFGPAVSLAGRNIGMDFEGIDGWRMYHGDVVPGFPSHPHRGFETVTVARVGLIDHSDSLGAAARYGSGDVQWLTAGKGIVHAEMFPLLDRSGPNPLELFQIWLNLPKKSKFAEPHFSMLWNHAIPRRTERDAAGKTTELTIIAGKYGDATPPSPPPKSWGSDPESDLAIWTFKMEPGAKFTLPAARPGTNRTLYFFRGKTFSIGGRDVPLERAVELRAEVPAHLENGSGETELLLLQGRPIGEPVVKHGPFVMNTREEIQQAFSDYRRTGFGGWPWQNHGPVHGAEGDRFARHADGRTERANDSKKG
jgi:redox-sensitive bicupin YhaK (pirin superfamily)